ncbi:efflux RND transporter periplasmic adaptor subunit [Thermophagus sp. OGC60D27]|uniref:efflux RND transporter periplasmic adaptor subunit n=1 Tax=Thermophagus sp. OGC60D27 TaxID=3458415 RepID=UPI00403784CB
MITKSIIGIALITMISCHRGGYTTQHHHDHDEHEHHGPEGVVMLTQQQMKALDLELGSFQQRNLNTLVKTNGQLEVPPGASADVTAIMGGNVKEIKVFHGDKVQKGQVLAFLEHPDYISLQEDFIETASRMEFLEQEYARQKELFEKNVTAGKDYQRVKSEYNTLKAKFEGLKIKLRMLNLSPDAVQDGNISATISVLSPLSGYVNDVNIRLGTFVDAKDILFRITDNREIHVDFIVYEKDLHLLKEGQTVKFEVAGLSNEEFSATIFAIGKELDRDSRSIHIHASLDENPGHLVPGMYASGSIYADAGRVVALPDEAVVVEGTKSYIFILDESIDPDDHEHHSMELHGDAESGDDHEGDDDQSDPAYPFRMVEVITGKQAGGYTEIKLMETIADDTKVAMNNAYYLLADLKKEETSHEH